MAWPMTSGQLFSARGAALLLIGLFALWGLTDPDGMRQVSVALTGTMLTRFGWLVMLLSTAAVGLVAWLGLGRHRHARLGLAGESAEFSNAAWIAMLFAAGMGTGLVTWAVAEPVTHFLQPPGNAVLAPAAAARQAMVLTFLHWGVHAWAIYALCGLVIAWFSFRLGRPPLVSAPLEGLLPGRRGVALKIGADSIGILAVTFGLAATLAMGVLALRSGFGALGFATGSTAVPFLTLLGLGSLAMLSALSGLGRGIRLLSLFNIGLALALMTAVLLIGPTSTLLSILVDSMGAYLAALPELSFRLRPLEGGAQWTADWTLTYLLWWLAWGPFVGVFIARISRGRTVGEFVAGVVIVPTLGSMLWFAVMGGSGLLAVMGQGADGPLAVAVLKEPTSALILMLQALPAGTFLALAAMLLLLTFIVTSIDSAIWVLAMMSSGGAENPSIGARLAWGVALLVLASAMLSVATVEATRAMAILGALPYPIILVLQSVALLRALTHDPIKATP